MPLLARRLIRKMRGGSQAHLVEAEDGHFYVVKLRNNPQHRRILVNEWLAAELLDYLRLSAPPVAVVELTEEFLAVNPDLCLQLGAGRISATPGWHFGSRYPGHPERLAVYDFLPDALLPKVDNLAMLAGALVFDKWVSNADARQCVFFRGRVREWVPDSAAHPLTQQFLALLVDHGYAFNGPLWDLPEVPAQGLYFRAVAYRGVRSLEDLQPWLDRVVHAPDHVLDRARKRVPPQWLNGDADALDGLLESLHRRQPRVPELVARACRERPALFPDWRG